METTEYPGRGMAGALGSLDALVLVGHGSRDPRSAQALGRLRDRVAMLTDSPVTLAFLELSQPLLEDVLAGLTGRVRIVPLLLGSAFHARVDLPGRLKTVADTRGDLEISVTGVLGPHPLLDAAVAAQAQALVAQGCDSVLVLGTGSSHQSANAEVDALADRLTHMLDVPVVAGFVTRGRSLQEADDALRRQGATRPGLVPWFLAPGLLLDGGLASARALGHDVASVGELVATLADDQRLARLVIWRTREAATARRSAQMLTAA
ncbi:MAG: CbiX/SirB N-terminal domain-containing protein [Micrococcales bacterium]|nr:CbiX/SirB N-terminal domain-containing protein [Micrococcales bacterium]